MVGYTMILFCRNHRKDRFDEPASCFRLDENADLPVDHLFPKLAFRFAVCRFNPVRSTKFLKTRERVQLFQFDPSLFEQNVIFGIVPGAARLIP